MTMIGHQRKPMQVVTSCRWLRLILLVSAFCYMVPDAFSIESKPTPTNETRTSRWKVVITKTYEQFPYREPGYIDGGMKEESHYQAIFDLTLKRERWSSHRWTGRA